LIAAVQNGHVKVAELLIGAGAKTEIFYRESNILDAAAKSHRTKPQLAAFALLLSRSACPLRGDAAEKFAVASKEFRAPYFNLINSTLPMPIAEEMLDHLVPFIETPYCSRRCKKSKKQCEFCKQN
jgi:hypothetical protein